jgi:hypothetical protein
MAKQNLQLNSSVSFNLVPDPTGQNGKALKVNSGGTAFIWGNNTLAEILASGNLAGGTSIILDSGAKLLGPAIVSGHLNLEAGVHPSNTGASGDINLSTLTNGVTTVSGNINLTSAAAVNTTGSLVLTSGTITNSVNSVSTSSGIVSLTTGNVSNVNTNNNAIASGAVSIVTGNVTKLVGSTASSINSGNISFTTGTANQASSGGISGSINFTTAAADGNAGSFLFTGGASTTAAGGSITFNAGNGVTKGKVITKVNSVNAAVFDVNTATSLTGAADGYVMVYKSATQSIQYVHASTIPGIVGSQNLSQVLTSGNITGANNLKVTDSQYIELLGTSSKIVGEQAVGGNVRIEGGSYTGAGNTGSVLLSTISPSGAGNTGSINLTTGGASGNSGSINISTSSTGTSSGAIQLYTGDGGSAASGDIKLFTGSGAVAAGKISICTGGSSTPSTAGGIDIISVSTGLGNTGNIKIETKTVGSTYNGGTITLLAGDGGISGSATGGFLSFRSGGGLRGGNIELVSGNSSGAYAGSKIEIFSGSTANTSYAGGELTLKAGSHSSTGTGGALNLYAGDTASGTGGYVNIYSGSGATKGKIRFYAQASIALTVDNNTATTLAAAGDGYVVVYNSATQSIKYVDPATISGGGGTQTLSNVLALGNTTGANDIVVSTGRKISGQTTLDLASTTGNALNLLVGSTNILAATTTASTFSNYLLSTGYGTTHQSTKPYTPDSSHGLIWTRSTDKKAIYSDNSLDKQICTYDIDGTVTTTNTTPTTAYTFGTSTGKLYQIKLYVLSATAAGVSQSWELSGTFKNVSGTLTQIGSTSIIVEEIESACIVDFTVSGTNVLVTVTGTSTSISWKILGRVIDLSF